MANPAVRMSEERVVAHKDMANAIRALAMVRKFVRRSLSPVDLLRRTVADEPAEEAGGTRSRLKIRSDAVLN